MTSSQLTHYLRAAMGQAPADLVLRGGRVADLYLGDVVEADVHLAAGRIVAVTERGAAAHPETPERDVAGGLICPGLIDAHYHIGGSHLAVGELAHALLRRGTTAIATDFYEIYTYAGPEGVREALDELAECGVAPLFLPPVHLLGLEVHGTFNWSVSADDMALMLGWPETVGINEPPAAVVLSEQPEVLDLVERTVGSGKLLAGHAPGMVGRELQAYASVGASSDHESQTASEALTKLRAGVRTMMRHGSAAPDMPALIAMARDHAGSTRWMMLCSDEVDPRDLATNGHMDHKLRLAIQAGVDPLVALQMCSLNVAEYYRVDHLRGSVTAGRAADLVVVDNLETFEPRLVISGGQIRNESFQSGGGGVSPLLRSRVRLPTELGEPQLLLAAGGPSARVRVITVRDGSLVSEAGVERVEADAGYLRADVGRDLLHIAVVERHTGSGRVGKAFTHGFGLKRGAVAMTYCHVYHNLLLVGVDVRSMVAAARELERLGGGIAVADGDTLLRSWSLPIVGVIGDEPLSKAEEHFVAINEALKDLGCQLAAPVLALSFVALPTIPELGLTDKGLYDVPRAAFVAPVLD